MSLRDFLYHEEPGITLYCGDALTVLRELPDASVQTCVTSPPYWGLRQYLFDGAIVVRQNLSDDKRAWLEAELQKRNIRPRQGG